MARTKAPPPSAGLRASVIRLGAAGVSLARDAASRLADGALDASAEARRQAEDVLRRLRGTFTDRFGVPRRADRPQRAHRGPRPEARGTRTAG